MGLLNKRLAFIKQRRLGVMIGEFFRLSTYHVAVERLRKGYEPVETTGLKRTATPELIRFVCNRPAMNGLSMHPVTLIIVDLVDRSINGQLVEIRATQTRNL